MNIETMKFDTFPDEALKFMLLSLDIEELDAIIYLYKNDRRILDMISSIKIQRAQQIHKFKVTFSGGFFMTRVITESGERKRIRAVTEDELWQKLYDFYFDSDEIPTLAEAYSIWKQYRIDNHVKAYTINHNRCDWERFYQSEVEFTSKKINKIKTDDVEKILNRLILEHSLKYKAYNNAKFILDDIFRKAVRDGYIKKNPLNDAVIHTQNCQRQGTKAAENRVYTLSEVEIVKSEINKRAYDCENKNTAYFGILLLFSLGIRVGELVALQWKDIDKKNMTIHIQRSESKSANINGLLRPIVGSVKSECSDRFLFLTDYELDIFDEIKKINRKNFYRDGDFIFLNEKGRRVEDTIMGALRRINRSLNIENRSPHDIRRTVASQMHENGMTLEEIRKYMGHSSIEQTAAYIFSTADKDASRRKHEEVLRKLRA